MFADDMDNNIKILYLRMLMQNYKNNNINTMQEATNTISQTPYFQKLV